MPTLPLGDYVQLLLKNGLLAEDTAALDLTRPVSALTCDSRAAVPGGLFICKGAAFKKEYLAQALGQGAFAYVSEVDYGVSAPCLRVADVRLAMALMADLCWDHPSGKVKVIGITGTKGKTTTAYFLKSILDAWREAQGLRPVGLLSTLITDDGVLRAPAALTTPEPLELQQHLFNAANAGCGYVVMECSSQALKYGRMVGVDLFTGAFLNLGEDHISPKEHPDAEDYFRSKLKIFDHSKNAVVNLDSDRAPEVLAAAQGCGRVLTYSLDTPSADLFAPRLTHGWEGSRFSVTYRGKEENFSIPLAGSFNVSNALCALAVRAGLERCAVPGRMETYTRDGKTVVVDYAHNGMALEALLGEVRRGFPGASVTAVFGSGGDKALDRREGMGKAAGKYADFTVLTEDDPGGEDVEEICRQIGEHIAAAGGEFTIIPDRETAVKTAIEKSQAPAVIVLAGKGAEQAQKRKNGPEPCAPDGLLAKKYLGLPLA